MTDKTELELLELERKYCSWGDTVHYLDPPKTFARSEGSYLFDREGTPYLDLQMSRTGTDVKGAGRHSFKCV
jgi:4-aminobutyrate aminotransferase-like enzyme